MCVCVCVCIYTHTPHLLRLIVDGHLGCFHALAIVNCAAINTGVHTCFELEFSSFPDIYPRVELPDHMVVLFLVFKETSIPFSIVVALKLRRYVLSHVLKIIFQYNSDLKFPLTV